MTPSSSEAATASGKVFGIGLSRTGTTKLCTILDHLGYRTCHFVPDLFDPPDWRVVDTADAFADSPIPLLYKVCDRRYPGSKFILTTRDMDDWLASMEWMFTHGKVLFNWGPRIHAYHAALYHTKRFDPERLAERWHAYHEEVLDHFAQRRDDLLVLDIGDGFDVETMCAFLGVAYREMDTATHVNARRSPTLRQRVGYVVKYPIRYAVWFGATRLLGRR